jgi:hypothetical protein
VNFSFGSVTSEVLPPTLDSAHPLPIPILEETWHNHNLSYSYTPPPGDGFMVGREPGLLTLECTSLLHVPPREAEEFLLRNLPKLLDGPVQPPGNAVACNDRSQLIEMRLATSKSPSGRAM